MTPRKMVEAIKAATAAWDVDAVAIGYPGVVKSDRVASEPKNLGKGWVGFDFEAALGKPVKMVNDAAMQALGSATKPGLTLFVGVGTGLGVALVLAEPRDDGTLSKRVIPTELGHARFSKRHDYESLVSKAALSSEGRKRWTKSLETVVEDFQRLFSPDQIVIGGGNVKQLKNFRETFPSKAIVPGDNDFAFAGGEALWGQ
jgi:predicted NBD/HSP70 family sugar kinase